MFDKAETLDLAANKLSMQSFTRRSYSVIDRPKLKWLKANLMNRDFSNPIKTGLYSSNAIRKNPNISDLRTSSIHIANDEYSVIARGNH